MNQRDLELLSSYLDGQLSPSDSARLEKRIHADSNLRAVLEDLRGARSLLRQLPMRKAPRNFRLTPKMVGKNPPLPRSYTIFKFATTLASLLLFITFSLNFISPQLASAPPAFGMGGGGGVEEETFAAEAAATEAPAAEEPSILMAPMPTGTITAQEDTARAATDVAKNGDTENGLDAGQEPSQVAVEEVPFVSSVWQWLLAGVALLSAFIMALMRQLAINRWRRK
jgi:anti-sigma factor RsiW